MTPHPNNIGRRSGSSAEELSGWWQVVADAAGELVSCLLEVGLGVLL
jgi:hypothetical protein